MNSGGQQPTPGRIYGRAADADSQPTAMLPAVRSHIDASDDADEPALAAPLADSGPTSAGHIYLSRAYLDRRRVAGSGTYVGRHSSDDPSAAEAGSRGRRPGERATDEDGSLTRNSAIMAAGSVASRVTGLLRTAVLAAAIGAKGVGDDYSLANNLPNQVYELLLGGVLTSVIVPLLIRAREHDDDRGESYAQRLLTLATVFLASTTVVAVAAAPIITELFRSSSTTASDAHLVTVLSYLLLPEIFFYGMAALLGAVLNTRGHFAAPMWTPILNNVVVIVTGGLFLALPVAAGGLSATTMRVDQILVLGVGSTLGIVVQAFGLVPALRRINFRWRWRWDWGKLNLRQLGHLSAWMLVYVAANQLALLVTLRFAYGAGSHGGPGVAIYNNAYIVFVMAHGVVAVSIGTALMPRLSAAAARRDFRDLSEQLSSGVRLSAVILIPATAVYVLLGRDLAIGMLRFGNYGHQEAVWTGWVIATAGLGLIPFAVSQLQLFALYATRDTKTPALVNLPVAALRVLLSVLMYLVLPVIWVAAGLMFSASVSYLLAVVLGYWVLRRRLGSLGLGEVIRTLTRLAIATLLASLPAGLVAVFVHDLLGSGWGASVLAFGLGSAVLVAVYVPLSLAMRVEEVSRLWQTISTRLGRIPVFGGNTRV